MRTLLALLVLLATAGCSGENDQSASRDDNSDVQNQFDELKKKNEESATRIAELEADKARRETEERAAEEARIAEEKRLEEIREAKRKLAETEAAIALEEERVRQLNMLLGAMPQEHFDRLKRITDGIDTSPEGFEWGRTLKGVGEKIAKKEPLNETDLAVLKSVDLAFWGTKDGAVLHYNLERKSANPRQLIESALTEYAPKLGIDRERTATLGVWMMMQQDVYEAFCSIRTIADKLHDGRVLTDEQLAIMRRIPALDDRRTEYEAAAADPNQLAAMYDNEAEVSRGYLRETQQRIDEARATGDSEAVRNLQGQLEAVREDVAEYERKAEETREGR